jgi:hypothetical protein
MFESIKDLGSVSLFLFLLFYNYYFAFIVQKQIEKLKLMFP